MDRRCSVRAAIAARLRNRPQVYRNPLGALLIAEAQMTRAERLLRLARLRGDRAAEIMLMARLTRKWTEAELRAAWGDR